MSLKLSHPQPAGTSRDACARVTAQPVRLGRALPLMAGLLCVWTPPADAKDVRTKWALGVEQSFGLVSEGLENPPVLSVKYTLPAAQKQVNMQLQGFVGFHHGAGTGLDDALSIQGGLRFLYPVVAEDNCNVLLGVTAGVGYYQTSFGQLLDPRGGAIFGVEFFPFGLENLGLFTAVSAQAGPVDQGTAAHLSMHYYF